MFETVRLEITTEHITSGVPEDCQRCPIALALKAAIPLATCVDVGPDICFHFGGRIYLGHSDEAEAWACDFDDLESVSPTTFDVSFEDIGAVKDVEDMLDAPCVLPVINGGRGNC